MEMDHVSEGFWKMPGKPTGEWPGTKNGRDHRVAVSDPARDLLESHLAASGSAQKSALLLKSLVAEFKLERASPHDLRRTCLTKITGLSFGRDAMDRVANHKKGGITDVYERWLQ